MTKPGYKELAALFGKKLGEPFYLKDVRTGGYILTRTNPSHPAAFYFQEDGLHSETTLSTCGAYFPLMLNGTCEIVDIAAADPVVQQILPVLQESYEKLGTAGFMLFNRNKDIHNTEGSIYTVAADYIESARLNLENAYDVLNPTGDIADGEEKSTI